MSVLELSSENIRPYLDSILLKLPFPDASIIAAEEVHDQTYVNWIFKIELSTKKGPQTLYLRQSRDHVKKKPDMKMDPARIGFEVKILELLKTIIPGTIPEVLWFDTRNNAVFLSDIKRDELLLVHELTGGKPHLETASSFGKTIAKVHGKTWGISTEEVRGSKELNDDAIDFNRGMRTQVAEERYPEITTAFLAKSSEHHNCLVLGDLASKNIFVDGTNVRFLDLERAFIGDSAFDLAFLFCHYLIEVPAKSLKDSLTFIKEFMKSYRQELSRYTSANEIEGIESRLITFLGITILYRLNGFYLAVNAGANKEIWEKKAEKLLLANDIKSFNEALQYLME